MCIQRLDAESQELVEAYRIPVTALLLNSTPNLQRIMLPMLSVFILRAQEVFALPLNDSLMVHTVACCAGEGDKVCRSSSCCTLKLQNHRSASLISQSFLGKDYSQGHPVSSPLFLVDPAGCQFQARHVFNLFAACYFALFQIL